MDTLPDDVEKQQQPVSHTRQMNQTPWLYTGFFCTSSKDTLAIMNETLNDAASLYGEILQLHQLHKLGPHILIKGSHIDLARDSDNSSSYETVVDFSITIGLKLKGEMLTCVAQEEDAAVIHRETTPLKRYTPTSQASNTDEDLARLYAWCERFSSSTTWLRIFRVAHSIRINNIDEEHLKILICKQLRSTGYRGRIEVIFGLKYPYVDFYNAGFINKHRVIWWLQFWAMVTFAWFPLWLLYLLTTWYWDVCAISYDVLLTIDDVPVSGEKWITRCGGLIAGLATTRYKGDATILLKHVTMPVAEHQTPSTLRTETAEDRAISKPHYDFAGDTIGVHETPVSGWGHNRDVARR